MTQMTRLERIASMTRMKGMTRMTGLLGMTTCRMTWMTTM